MTRHFAQQLMRSFTLVEILTATAVLSVLFTIMFGIFQQTSKGWQSANRRVESVQAVRLALDQITSDLENCLVVVRSNVPLPIANFSVEGPTFALTNPLTNYAFGFAHANAPGTLPAVFNVNRSRIEMPPLSDSISVVTPFSPSLGQGTNTTGSDLSEAGYFVVFVRDTNGYSTMRGLRYYLLRHQPLTNHIANREVYFPENDFLTNSAAWENSPSNNPISTVNRLPFIDNCLVFDLQFLTGQAGSFTTNATWPRPSLTSGPGAGWTGLPKAAVLTLCVVDERTAERLGRWFPTGLTQTNLSLILASVTNPAILNTVEDRPPGLRSTLREGVVGFQRMIYFKNATN